MAIVYVNLSNEITYRIDGVLKAGETILTTYPSAVELFKDGFPKWPLQGGDWLTVQEKRRQWLEKKGIPSSWIHFPATPAATPVAKKTEAPTEDPSMTRDRIAMMNRQQAPVSKPIQSVDRPLCPLQKLTPVNSWGRPF